MTGANAKHKVEDLEVITFIINTVSKLHPGVPTDGSERSIKGVMRSRMRQANMREGGSRFGKRKAKTATEAVPAGPPQIVRLKEEAVSPDSSFS